MLKICIYTLKQSTPFTTPTFMKLNGFTPRSPKSNFPLIGRDILRVRIYLVMSLGTRVTTDFHGTRACYTGYHKINSYTAYHETMRHGLVADTKSQAD
jgi:hypothetical protein